MTTTSGRDHTDVATFVDYWARCWTHGDDFDVVTAFRDATESARWIENPHDTGNPTGTLADKSEVVLVQPEPVGWRDAKALAYRLLIDDPDPRFTDPHGPAGAVPVRDEHGDAWCLFGWSPYCHDRFASLATSDHGDTVFTDMAAADRWVGGRDDRTAACPQCAQVHMDLGDAFGCCGTDQGVPVWLRDGVWRKVAADYLA